MENRPCSGIQPTSKGFAYHFRNQGCVSLGYFCDSISFLKNMVLFDDFLKKGLKGLDIEHHLSAPIQSTELLSPFLRATLTSND